MFLTNQLNATYSVRQCKYATILGYFSGAESQIQNLFPVIESLGPPAILFVEAIVVEVDVFTVLTIIIVRISQGFIMVGNHLLKDYYVEI